MRPTSTSSCRKLRKIDDFSDVEKSDLIFNIIASDIERGLEATLSREMAMSRAEMTAFRTEMAVSFGSQTQSIDRKLDAQKQSIDRLQNDVTPLKNFSLFFLPALASLFTFLLMKVNWTAVARVLIEVTKT